MHELSIAMRLVEAASEEAARLGVRHIAVIFVRIGALSGVVGDALRFALDIAAEGSIAEGARLELEPVEGRELQLRAMEVLDDDAANC